LVKGIFEGQSFDFAVKFSLCQYPMINQVWTALTICSWHETFLVRQVESFTSWQRF
jgi:hypothetical protein